MDRQNSIVSEQILAQGELLKLSRYNYIDHRGNESLSSPSSNLDLTSIRTTSNHKKICEVVGRRHMDQPSEPDCVGTLAVLRRKLKYDCLVLVKQYRPPLKAFTLEIPAGLVNPDETPEQTAARELKEETGYTASSTKHVSSLTAMDPGLANCTMKVVTMEVDGESPDNQSPTQSPEDKETIEVVHIPIDSLLPRLKEYSSHGVIIDSRVYCFAIGLALGTTHSSKLNHHQLTINQEE